MKVGIIGAGKVGISVGYTMTKNGIDVEMISDREDSALNNARQYLGDKISLTKDNMEVLKNSDVVFITTQDRVIKDIVAEIDARAERLDGKLIIHTSGAHPSYVLKPLDIKGATLGVVHPLQTFPDIESGIRVLPDTYIFIEGSEEGMDRLTFIGENIGKKVVMIKGDNMVLYHLSAVFVCNLLCALLYASENIMEKIGIGLEPFFPIINATLRNIEQKGPLASLTGPIVRGDLDTVVSHLKAMRDMGEYKDVYRVLSQVAVDMAEKKGIVDKKILEEIEEILKKG